MSQGDRRRSPFFLCRSWRAAGGLLDAIGANTLGADPDSLGLAIYQRANPLQVRVPATIRLVVGMTDVMAERRSLATDFTYARHEETHSVLAGNDSCLRERRNVAGSVVTYNPRDSLLRPTR